MLASYRVHEISSRDALTPGLSVLRTKVFRSLVACKTFYHQTCAKTSPILLFGHAALPPRIPKQFLTHRECESHPSTSLTFRSKIVYTCGRQKERSTPTRWRERNRFGRSRY